MERPLEATRMENSTSSCFLMERKTRVKINRKEVMLAKLRKSCSCTPKKLKNFVMDFLPVLRWLPKYQCKEYIWGDVMSGLVIGIILVPQAIAYSLLAGLKPIYSLYTSFFANIIYFLMGTSRHVSVGIFSLISLMVGQVVDRELLLAGFDLNDDAPSALGDGSLQNDSQSNTTAFNLTIAGMNAECGKECYAIGIATALTFVAGVYQVLMGIFRLGFVSMYLSESVLDGFATGASLTILTAQVKYLIGIKIPRSQGHGMLIITWINIFRNISQANLCDVITSAICIVVLVTAKELGDRYKHKLKFPLPTELVVIVVATLVSHYGKLNEVYASSVSGAIPTGFIPPKVPHFNLMLQVAVDALPLAIVSFVFTVSLSEMCAKKYAYTIRANQEMFAVGFCNIIPSFFHSFATSAALAKTLVKTSTGCQTQVSGVISAMVVLLVLLFLAPLFYSLQKCVLACIIIVSLRGALRKFRDVPKRYHVNKVDTLVWVITMSASALISTEIGLLVGIVFSMLCIIVRTQRPRTTLLGQIQDTSFYEDDLEYENLSSVPKVKIFRFEAPLYYANRNYFLKSLYRLTNLDPNLEAARRKKYEKKEKQHLRKGNHTTANGLGIGETTLQLVPKQIDFEALVVDCSSISFLDTTGVNTLKEILKDYKDLNISVLLACCNPSVIESLKRGGYFGKDFGTTSTSTTGTSHLTKCDIKQKAFCVNGGECYMVKDLPNPPRYLCRCPNEFTGDRCQNYVMASFYKAEELYQKRVLTITGICIALLVVGIMCVVAYCKTKKQRKKLHDRLRQSLRSERNNVMNMANGPHHPNPPPDNVQLVNQYVSKNIISSEHVIERETETSFSTSHYTSTTHHSVTVTQTPSHSWSNGHTESILSESHSVLVSSSMENSRHTSPAGPRGRLNGIGGPREGNSFLRHARETPDSYRDSPHSERYVSAMTTPARMSPVDFHTPTSPKSPPSKMSPPASSLTVSVPSVAVSPFIEEERPLLLVTPPRLREKYDDHLQQFNSFHHNPAHESNSLPPSPLRIVEDEEYETTQEYEPAQEPPKKLTNSRRVKRTKPNGHISSRVEVDSDTSSESSSSETETEDERIGEDTPFLSIPNPVATSLEPAAAYRLSESRTNPANRFSTPEELQARLSSVIANQDPIAV